MVGGSCNKSGRYYTFLIVNKVWDRAYSLKVSITVLVFIIHSPQQKNRILYANVNTDKPDVEQIIYRRFTSKNKS